MIILLGGESMAGKTLMAQKLLEIYKIPYLSIDHLKMGLFRAHAHCGFTPNSPNAAIEARLWPVLKGIIDVGIENRQSLIIEGCYLLPHRLGAFSAAQRAQIIPVFMGFSEGYLRRHFADGVLRHRSAIEQRQAPEERSMEWFIHANQRLKAMCAESGARYFEIDGDYGKDTRAIYAWIDTKMKKDTP